MKNYKLVFSILLLLPFQVINAQDFHLTQYDAAALNLNPSLTGLFNGKHRFHIHYRTQWQAIANEPFQTGYISYDAQIKKGFSAGVSIANYNAGTGSYNEFQMMGSASYRMPIDKKKNHNLSFGIQAGFFTKSINFSKLSFGQQYVENANGGEFNTSLPSGELPTNNSTANFDLNAGITYFYSKMTSKVNPFAGFSVYHLNFPNESFYDSKNKLPLRYVLNAGVKVAISPLVTLIPKVMYQHQKKANEVLVGLIAQGYLKSVDLILFGGPNFRSKDAFNLELGAKWKDLEFRVSYDINVSSLNVSTTGRGGTELSLTYIIKETKPNPVPSCPRL